MCCAYTRTIYQVSVTGPFVLRLFVFCLLCLFFCLFFCCCFFLGGVVFCFPLCFFGGGFFDKWTMLNIVCCSYGEECIVRLFFIVCKVNNSS